MHGIAYRPPRSREWEGWRRVPGLMHGKLRSPVEQTSEHATGRANLQADAFTQQRTRRLATWEWSYIIPPSPAGVDVASRGRESKITMRTERKKLPADPKLMAADAAGTVLASLPHHLASAEEAKKLFEDALGHPYPGSSPSPRPFEVHSTLYALAHHAVGNLEREWLKDSRMTHSELAQGVTKLADTLRKEFLESFDRLDDDEKGVETGRGEARKRPAPDDDEDDDQGGGALPREDRKRARRMGATVAHPLDGYTHADIDQMGAGELRRMARGPDRLLRIMKGRKQKTPAEIRAELHKLKETALARQEGGKASVSMYVSNNGFQ
ncbi:hypothetical protein DM02DRAFT_654768 [Periconia macrospinosa]|uniref:Uncharacterized protein n=1 Tax=Periconia macrospinosa TaxID=97972 RepID=A0A2V1DT93_9PLEO|nr:hypothetical protein DM02DRAFT_654768 [Periconia macrospinosa]